MEEKYFNIINKLELDIIDIINNSNIFHGIKNIRKEEIDSIIKENKNNLENYLYSLFEIK